MTDNIDQLAAEYWDTLMEAEPTWRHLLGDFGAVGDYESASRASEDEHIATFRSFAERAQQIDAGALSDDQRVTREVLVYEAGTRADLLEARLREHAADPIFGAQAELALIAGMLGVPDAEVAEAMLDKGVAIGRHFRELAERQREGVASGRVSPEFAVTGTVKQIDEALAVPAADDPILEAVNLPDGVDVEAWRAARYGRLEAPDSWLTLVGLHWVEEGTHAIGSGKDNDIVLNTGPAKLGTLTRKGTELTLALADGVAAKIGDNDARTAVLAPDASGAPTIVRFGNASFALSRR